MKPRIFISHASSDGEFANAVKLEIEKVFNNAVEVFNTSSPGAIEVGRDWLSEIENALSTAQVVIAIVTPISIERPWLWFEIGATWAKGSNSESRIYPLIAPEINMSDLPSPLDRLQALSMGKAVDLKLLFQALIDQFGSGKISSFRASNITKRIPKYKDVKIKDIDLGERGFYSGRYSSYTDPELMEIIDTRFVLPDEEKIRQHSDLYQGREELIHNGKLVHFREVDRKLDLPPGTAKRLLISVAQRYGLVTMKESENIVRFRGV